MQSIRGATCLACLAGLLVCPGRALADDPLLEDPQTPPARLETPQDDPRPRVRVPDTQRRPQPRPEPPGIEVKPQPPEPVVVPKPEPRRELPVVAARPRTPEPDRPLTTRAYFDTRYVFIPNGLADTFWRAHPGLDSVSFSGGVVWEKSRSWGFEAGLSITPVLTPAANWLLSGASGPETKYTSFSMALVSLQASFLKRVPIRDPVSLLFAGGLGFGFFAGRSTTTEVLPTCTTENAATCPHWRDVAKDSAPLWPVFPSFRLSAGVEFDLTKQFSLRIEGGVRDLFLFGGGGIGVAF